MTTKVPHHLWRALTTVVCGGLLFVSGACPSAADEKDDDKPEKSPPRFHVKLETGAGKVVIIEVTREWAPIGADRFHHAVKSGFYNECRFFRVVPEFIVQFGINGDPKTQAKWREMSIKDDPVTQSNKRGTLTFATAGPDTRTTQLFINLRDNNFLDRQGFSPFGRVVKGMETVDAINAEYGERPIQALIQEQGNEYLNRAFPKLDFIKKATILTESDLKDLKLNES